MQIEEQVDYDRVAALTRYNFDKVHGGRARAAEVLPLAPAQISNLFTQNKQVRSWRGLKMLIRWFLETNINVGDWDEVLIRLNHRFPEEGWDKLNRKKSVQQPGPQQEQEQD